MVAMNQAQRIGVFGGTFDPIHNAHLSMARTAMETASLDKVLFVVSSIPPHKQNNTHASPEDRVAMVEAAIKGETRFDVSDMELRREGPSYTADTLKELQEEYPEATLFMIIGQDSLVDFPKWRQPEVIMNHAHLLVLPRQGSDTPIDSSLDGHYDMLPFVKSTLSSTKVRTAIKQGEPIDSMLPRKVEELIKERGLYGS